MAEQYTSQPYNHETKQMSSSSSSSSSAVSTGTTLSTSIIKSTSSSSFSLPSPTGNILAGADNTGFHHLGHGIQAAVAVLAISFAIAIVFWVRSRRRTRRTQEIQTRNNALRETYDGNRGLPLSDLQTPAPVYGASRGGGGVDAPPMYAEVVPPMHQRIAGGITNVREEEEGVISDGKMPLSEIPFEDVDVVRERERRASGGSESGNGIGNGIGNGGESEARRWGMGTGGRGDGMGGDTRGFTNS